MANTAAHLVDRVLPSVPVRQWVLSLPFELRSLAAFDAKVRTALVRIFAAALAEHYRAWGRRQTGAPCESGAITFVQRFGSSLNLNVHFHVVALDGVFVRDSEGRATFHAAPSPSPDELACVVERVHRRSLAWLTRRGHLDRSPLEARSNEAPAQTPLDACAGIAMRRGTIEHDARRDQGSEVGPAELESAAPAHGAAIREGFNLHASVHIDAADDLWARAPLSLRRASAVLARAASSPPGRAPRLPHQEGTRRRREGAQPDPARAARAVVRARATAEVSARPLPRSARAPLVVAKSCRAATAGGEGETAPARGALETRGAQRGEPRTSGQRDERRRRDALAHREERRRSAAVREDDVGGFGFATRGARSGAAGAARPQRDRRASLGATAWRSAPRDESVPWSILLRRTFDVDVLECAKCHGRLRVLGAIEDPVAARAILERLGCPTEAPAQVRARDPSLLDGGDGHAEEMAG